MLLECKLQKEVLLASGFFIFSLGQLHIICSGDSMFFVIPLIKQKPHPDDSSRCPHILT